MTGSASDASQPIDASGWSTPLWLFCFFLAVPSLAMIERLLQVVLQGLPSLPLHATVLLAQSMYLVLLVFASRRLFAGRLPWHERLSDWLVLAVLVLLFLLFLWLYPLADSGRFGFYSDRDEAIDVATRQLLAGHYPYGCKAVSGIHDGCPTVGNPIAPLPGALLVSAPFVLLWGSALQSFFWLTVFYLASRSYTLDAHRSALHLLSVMLLAPVLIAELLSGGDLIANALAVSALVLLALRARTLAGWILCGLLLGVVLAWRAPFLLLAVPLTVYHLRVREGPRLVWVGGSAAFSMAAVTLPFWLVQPDGFAPFAIQQRFDDFAHLLPHGNLIAIGGSVLLGVVLGLRARSQDQLLVACGATLMVPMLLAIVLNSVDAGYPTFLFYGWYALGSLFLGSLGTMMQAFSLGEGRGVDVRRAVLLGQESASSSGAQADGA